MDTYYLARLLEIRHFGHLARRIHRLPPPVSFHQSFARTVEKGMANRGPNQPLERRQEGWQEDWMEDDDLLGEEQDLRRQLQRGARNFGENSQGRRMESASHQGAIRGDQGRLNLGKGVMGDRFEANRGPP